jgi:L-threonylcarbamoyladenylate synthase
MLAKNFVYTKSMILYPTETIYGLGVNPFDEQRMAELFAAKGRDERKVSAWLVRNVEDIERYADVSQTAEKIATSFLPGPLTLVLPAKDTVPKSLQSDSGTIGLRISADPKAQALINRFYAEYDAPLTCTSANVSGLETGSTPEEIVAQFKTHSPQFNGFSEVIDDGPRGGAASTVVAVIEDEITVVREGQISKLEIETVTA